jgi:hypothetical protein
VDKFREQIIKSIDTPEERQAVLTQLMKIWEKIDNAIDFPGPDWIYGEGLELILMTGMETLANRANS